MDFCSILHGLQIAEYSEETLIEFYHTENIVDNKVIHEYDYVNEVQLVTVKVHYQLFTLTNTYELLVVDLKNKYHSL